MKFEQIFKGELPKFDVSFGRGKFSKLNQLNISKSSQSVNKSNIISKSNSSSCIINSPINRLNNNNNNSQIQQQQQRKSLNTSASAKLSSKIKKKYSKQKSNEENNKRVVSNGNKNVRPDEDDEFQELFKLAFNEIKMLESQRLMDCKSK
jgi:hypothetical protein